MRFTHALRALSFATVVAIASVTVISAPVSATDPAPTASPDASAPIESAAPDPTTDPAAAPATDPTVEPSADPLASPDPAASPDPLASTAPDPAATPVPDAAAPSPIVAAPAAAAAIVKPKPSIRARILRIALAQRHKAYVRGGVGPRSFDCSGMVRYVFRKAGVSSKLGGGHSARAMYRWAVRHHLTSRRNPRIGDVVVWGRGSHVGIYIGHGKVISALNPRQDVRITRLHALGAPFTTFIHVRVGR